MNLPRYSKIGFIARRLNMRSDDLLDELRRRKIKPDINITIKPGKSGGVKAIQLGGHYDMKKMAKYFPKLLESK